MKSLEDLKRIREEAARKMQMRDKKEGYRVVVGMATCGITAGARPVLNKLVEEVADRKLDNGTVTQVGCMGECALEPIVEVYDPDGARSTYCKVDPAKAVRILEEHVIGGKVVDDLLIEKFRK